MIIAVILLIPVFSIIIFRIFNANLSKEQKLSRTDRFFKENKSIFNGFAEIYSEDGNLLHRCEKNMKENDSFFIASITKLYTHALIYILADEGKITLDDRISQILPENIWQGINVKDREDFSAQITIKHLLDQNAGLPDYEAERINDEDSLMHRLILEDFSLSPSEIIEIARKFNGRSKPGGSKSHYCNLNAVLLGMIIEEKAGMPLQTAMEKYIFTPLELKETRAVSADEKIIPFYFVKHKLKRVEYMKSVFAAGGLVSTNKDIFRFLQAFFTGQLFSVQHIKNPKFRPIQFIPLEYGAGMMRMKLSFLISPFIDCPEIIGHSGMTGSFAFYCPKRKLYIIGTTNQIKPQPFKVIYKYLDALS